jgi:hypothetical protein
MGRLEDLRFQRLIFKLLQYEKTLGKKHGDQQGY